MPEVIICEAAEGKGPNCTCSERGNCTYGHECSCDWCRAYWRGMFRQDKTASD